MKTEVAESKLTITFSLIAWKEFVKNHIKKNGLNGNGFLSVRDREMFNEGFKSGKRY